MAEDERIDPFTSVAEAWASFEEHVVAPSVAMGAIPEDARAVLRHAFYGGATAVFHSVIRLALAAHADGKEEAFMATCEKMHAELEAFAEGRNG